MQKRLCGHGEDFQREKTNNEPNNQGTRIAHKYFIFPPGKIVTQKSKQNPNYGYAQENIEKTSQQIKIKAKRCTNYNADNSREAVNAIN